MAVGCLDAEVLEEKVEKCLQCGKEIKGKDIFYSSYGSPFCRTPEDRQHPESKCHYDYCEDW